jgi:hypothetical protein
MTVPLSLGFTKALFLFHQLVRLNSEYCDTSREPNARLVLGIPFLVDIWAYQEH